jgi:hypothetical protein
MATTLSPPGDRLPTRTVPCRPIVPAALWPALTPVQQQHVRQTLAAIYREWLVTLSPKEATPDE